MKPILFYLTSVLGCSLSLVSNVSYGQCTGTPSAASLDIDYDCATGVANVMLVPQSTLTDVIAWIVSPGYYQNSFGNNSPIWSSGLPFPESYTITAYSFVDNELIIDCFDVNLNECPGATSFIISDAGCNDNDGSVCIDDVNLEEGTLACAGVPPSVDGCLEGLGGGGYFCLLGMPTVNDISETFLNMHFYITNESFEVDIESTPYDENCEGASLFADVTGGSSNFSYSWSGPGWIDIGLPDEPTTDISGGYGYLTVTVVDQISECIVTEEIAFLGNNCLGYDLDNNDVVNVSDLTLFMADFSTSGGCSDFDGNGVVNVLDLILFMSGFGVSC